MSERTKWKLKKNLFLALKIWVGGSLAYYIAELLHLEFASSAGIIALLTLQTTKWGTLKLSVHRLLTYFMSFGLCWILFHVVHTPWLDYGLYLLIVVVICEFLGWRSTVSVNAVIGAHFLSTQNFSLDFMVNELMLVIIGITIAIILNLFHINNAQESGIIASMRSTEQKMKRILLELAGYLRHQAMGDHVWDDIVRLEQDLDEYSDLAHEYQSNTFVSHPEYYINYFRMRKQQCGVLHNLHAEMHRISNLPKQAEIVADYITDMSEHVTEMNDPEKQINQLESLLEDMGNQPLPQTREEF